MSSPSANQRDPRITIEYCKQCRWNLRAAWYAQELLTTFQDDIGEVALMPSSGGAFFIHVRYQDKITLIWDRKAKGGFPEAKELKQLVRDIIKPEKDLGHSDTPMSRAKNVVDASDTVDGPVNTVDDKPADNTTTEHAKQHETERLPDGPVSTIGQERHSAGVQNSLDKAKALCEDCV